MLSIDDGHWVVTIISRRYDPPSDELPLLWDRET
jgi:hypothetical protein